ncbi:hypothetical protein GCM10010420_27980 [Streptomyces glaucosporus]|uniref:Hydrogenase expression protein HypF n=1 Tax=Streptomyces glaucosporus TaxID=284044 RepID=A0ABN3IC75_9ACTN
MTPDEVRQEGGAGTEPSRRAKGGPRHAAPRKPLLSRLHVPAGKAIALAAMPSAVLMGMGLTPRLAIAEPLPKNPFKDGPCVTAPDKEAEEDEAEAGESPRPESPRPETSAPAPEAGAPAEEKPGTGAGTGGTGDGTAGSGTASGSAGKGEDTGPGETESRPAPPAAEGEKEEERRSLLDPLGLGDALRDLFTPGGKDERADEEPGTSPAASPSPSPSSAAGGSGGSAEGGTGGKAGEGLRDAAGTVREGLEKAVGGAKDAAGKAGETGKDAGETGEDAEVPEDAVPPGTDASGKEPFPCPTYDAEALANAEEERTEAVLPDAPWRLESSLLALHGLDYQGIVKVRTHNGTVKNVLKFTARSIDIRDLHQLVEGPGGTTSHVRAAKGSTSTFRNGTVTMYTEELEGKLFGLIPITFSPESPPPVNIPEVFFTDVTVRQAGQFGGELHIPGMNLSNEA